MGRRRRQSRHAACGRGALIGGLGGGTAFSTIGGAAGAGLASRMAGELDAISKGVASATGSNLIGNLAGNVAAGLGGAVVDGTAGAATGSAVELYNQQLDTARKKNSLAPSGCSAFAPCNETVAMAQINAAGANAQVASDSMKAKAPYIGATLALGFLGPEVLISAATMGSLDLVSDTGNYLAGLSNDKPNIGKSYATGLIAGAFGPLSIGDEAVAGMSRNGIIAAGSYNALVNATSAFGTAATTNGKPDLSAGLAAGTTVAGYAAQAVIPGAAGAWANKTIQNSAGTIQNMIQKN